MSCYAIHTKSRMSKCTHAHTHTHTHMCTFVCVCVCVRMCVNISNEDVLLFQMRMSQYVILDEDVFSRLTFSVPQWRPTRPRPPPLPFKSLKSIPNLQTLITHLHPRRGGKVVYQGEFLGDMRDGHGDGTSRDGSRYVRQIRDPI